MASFLSLLHDNQMAVAVPAIKVQIPARKKEKGQIGIHELRFFLSASQAVPPNNFHLLLTGLNWSSGEPYSHGMTGKAGF